MEDQQVSGCASVWHSEFQGWRVNICWTRHRFYTCFLTRAVGRKRPSHSETPLPINQNPGSQYEDTLNGVLISPHHYLLRVLSGSISPAALSPIFQPYIICRCDALKPCFHIICMDSPADSQSLASCKPLCMFSSPTIQSPKHNGGNWKPWWKDSHLWQSKWFMKKQNVNIC